MGMKTYDRYSRAVIRSKRWEALRLQALRRDGFRCCECGCVGRLEVDHIVRVKPETMAGAYDLENLQTLCGPCHSRKTAIETGIAPLDPKRQRWRNLVRALAAPNSTKEPLCLNP